MKRYFLLALLFITIFNVNIVVKAIDDPNIIGQSYTNYDNVQVSCGTKNGKALIDKIPQSIPKLTHRLYLAILVAVPVALVILGMLDLLKGLSSQKEEEIKKGQQIFVKRLLSAGIVFSVLMIVKLIIGFVADSNSSRIVSCIECFIDGTCK